MENKKVVMLYVEDAAEGNPRLLKELTRPTKGIFLGDYIDNWLVDRAMTVTGIPAKDLPKEDKIRFTYRNSWE